MYIFKPSGGVTFLSFTLPILPIPYTILDLDDDDVTLVKWLQEDMITITGVCTNLYHGTVPLPPPSSRGFHSSQLLEKLSEKKKGKKRKFMIMNEKTNCTNRLSRCQGESVPYIRQLACRHY